MRAHLTIMCSPTVGATVLSAACLVAYLARQSPDLSLDGGIRLSEAARLGALHASTFVGLTVAAIAAGSFWNGTAKHREEERQSLLVPSARRRTALRIASVTCTLWVLAVVSTAMVVAVAVAQTIRAGGHIELSFAIGAQTVEIMLRALLSQTALAAFVVLGSTTFSRSEAVAGAACSVALAWCCLLLQHLLDVTGDRFLPTAWVGRLLQLRGDELGQAYLWTSGATGESALGPALLVLTSALVLAAAGASVANRFAKA